MFMRNGLGRVFQAWSEDNGGGHGHVRTDFPSLPPRHPLRFRTLPNGHLLAVWNQETEDEIKRGYNRTRVSAAISRNGGSVWEFFQNVGVDARGDASRTGSHSSARPAEYNFDPGLPAPEREQEHILSFDFHGRWSYPSVLVMKDRVLITHTYSFYEEHPTRAEMILSSQKEGGFNSEAESVTLDVVLRWERSRRDNPVLARIYEPARP